MSKYVPVGKSAQQMRAEQAAQQDAQTLVTRCALCEWHYTGTAANGRKQAAEHRADRHPERRQTLRRRGTLQRFGVSHESFREEGVAGAAEVAAMLKRRDAA